MDGYKVQGKVWNTQDPERATARYLNIRPTTQLLYQGTGSRKNEARRAARYIIVDSRVAGSDPMRGRFAFLSLILR